MIKMEVEDSRLPERCLSLKRNVEIVISVFMISLLFFLMIILAFKADIRTAGLMDKPIIYLIVFTNIVSTLFHIYNIHTKKVKVDIYSMVMVIITLSLCNVVLGYCTYSYINTLRLDDLLILFIAGILLKYITTHLANFIDKIKNGRNSL